MERKNLELKVTTEDGTECLIYETADGTMATLFSEGGGKYFHKELVGVDELELGKHLQFSYKTSLSSIEEFTSKSPIVSIEED